MNEGPFQHERRIALPAISDEELLTRFVGSRDEEAFAELAGRHAALVMSVCRRVLVDPHDADDAFQATFIVLAARAGRIRCGAAVAAWLYGVAFRTARRLAVRRRRQPTEPLPEVVQAHADPLTELTARHDRHIVDEELNRLPSHYREPLVLHYLEGKSRQRVAEALGATVTAIDGRMKRGRRRLRMRLVARGVSVGGVLTAIALARAAERPAPHLVVETVKAGLSMAGGTTSSATGSAVARQLAREEVTGMTLVTTTKIVAAALVGALVLLGAGGLGALNAQQATASGEGATIALPPGPSDAAADDPSIELAQSGASGDGSTAEVGSAPATAEAALPMMTDDAVENRQAETLDYKRRSPAEERIAAALDEQTNIEFVETPLTDAMTFLSDLHSIPIVFDRAGLEEEGIGVDEPITAVLAENNLRDTLDLLLEPLDLDYVIRKGVLQITSIQRANRLMETHVYELRHLRGFDTQEVVLAICTTIHPGQWRLPPGWDGLTQENDSSADLPRGALVLVDDALIVTHSQRVHEEITDLLEQLARFKANPR